MTRAGSCVRPVQFDLCASSWTMVPARLGGRKLAWMRAMSGFDNRPSTGIGPEWLLRVDGKETPCGEGEP